MKSGDEYIALVITEPLTNEQWIPYPLRKLLVFKDGRLLNLHEGLKDDEFLVLKYIRQQPHRVKIRKLRQELGFSQQKVEQIISSLFFSKNLIKRHTPDINRGIPWNSPEASYYTVPERRRYIDVLLTR